MLAAAACKHTGVGMITKNGIRVMDSHKEIYSDRIIDLFRETNPDR